MKAKGEKTDKINKQSNRTRNSKINSLHKKFLRIISSSKKSSFEKLVPYTQNRNTEIILYDIICKRSICFTQFLFC